MDHRAHKDQVNPGDEIQAIVGEVGPADFVQRLGRQESYHGTGPTSALQLRSQFEWQH
ncbi:MAG: hypothetical protein ACREIH_01370 [Nitrospiraceae bacterium]